MIHALIISPRDCWKHDFIRRITNALDCPVFGYETQREPERTTSDLGDPIYIHPFGGKHHFSEDNLVGYCINHKPHTVPGVFNHYAPQLLLPIPSDSILAFDEIGFMEAQEEDFCRAIRARLDGNIPVIATVKDKNIPFLMELRNHPKCHCFFLEKNNQEILFQEVLTYINGSLSETRTKNENKRHK